MRQALGLTGTAVMLICAVLAHYSDSTLCTFGTLAGFILMCATLKDDIFVGDTDPPQSPHQPKTPMTSRQKRGAAGAITVVICALLVWIAGRDSLTGLFAIFGVIMGFIMLAFAAIEDEKA